MANEKTKEIVYLTRDKFRELENELRILKTSGRAEIAAKIAEARAHGDLSENAEYDAAKEAQQHHEYKIAKLELIITKARIIEAKDLPNDKIYILSKVKLKNLKNNNEIEYQLVSPEEANFEELKISVSSPIGKSLLGKSKGDKIEVRAPAGIIYFEILEISR